MTRSLRTRVIIAIGALVAFVWAHYAHAQFVPWGGGAQISGTPAAGDAVSWLNATTVQDAGYTVAGSAGQTYTFPAITGTVVLSTSSPGMTGTLGFTTGSINFNGTGKLQGAGIPIMSGTAVSAAPTGCGTGAAIVNSAGSISISFTVGTTPTSACTITFPNAATHGYHCIADDITTTTEVIHQTGGSTTTCVLTFYAIATGTATAPTASDTVLTTSTGY